jgi:hypothetical protein
MPVSLYSRYFGLQTVVIQGRASLAQRPIPPIVDYPDSLVHALKAGETLDQLAFRYYGREDLWWRIADANPAKFPLDWAPGDLLTIPPLRVATRTPGR